MQHHKSKKEKRKKIEDKKSNGIDVSDPGTIEAPKVSKNPSGPMEKAIVDEAPSPDENSESKRDIV